MIQSEVFSFIESKSRKVKINQLSVFVKQISFKTPHHRSFYFAYSLF
jgi:hypothetical protein